MKSGKQRRDEIRAKRLLRAAKLNQLAPRPMDLMLQLGAVEVDHAQLGHNNTYGLLPDFYVDKPFVCRDCGTQEIWTAKQQKWWYEIAKGNIDSQAVRCRPCRIIERQRVEAARRVSSEGLARKLAEKKLKEEK
jgi:hypothetical protein